MIKFVITRILMMIPLLLTVTVVIFTIMYVVPGDPVTISSGAEVLSDEQLNAIRETMGLNKSYFVRLFEYVRNVFLRLDFGASYSTGTRVGPEILRRLWNTIYISLLSLVLMVFLGVPIGIRAAVKANKVEDRISMFLTLMLSSMPVFWFALLLALFFSLRLNWLPSYGTGSFAHFILPSLASGLHVMAGIARQTRSSMLEVIRSDYVTTARSKGLRESSIIYGHALQNALIPIITVCGNQFGRMIGGVVLVETIFTIPGIGTYLINGIQSRDYNMVQGCLIVIAFLLCSIMLITDVIYAYVDPRIRARYVRSMAD